jgi:hypothetical protein
MDDGLDALSVSQLRKLLAANSVNSADCLEKVSATPKKARLRARFFRARSRVRARRRNADLSAPLLARLAGRPSQEGALEVPQAWRPIAAAAAAEGRRRLASWRRRRPRRR